MLYAFHFIGSLASWPHGAEAHYRDARQSAIASAARLGPLRFLKRLRSRGHQVSILTDRGQEHGTWLRLWLQTFIGHQVLVIKRPRLVGLSCRAQAAWKAAALDPLDAEAYVGHKYLIDHVAAEAAGTQFIDTARCMQEPSMANLDATTQVLGSQTPSTSQALMEVAWPPDSSSRRRGFINGFGVRQEGLVPGA